MLWKIDAEVLRVIIRAAKAEGYTLTELAGLAGMHVASFKRLVAGRSMASDANIAKLRVIWPNLPATAMRQVLIGDPAHARIPLTVAWADADRPAVDAAVDAGLHAPSSVWNSAHARDPSDTQEERLHRAEERAVARLGFRDA